MEFNELVRNVEAMIFASDRPLSELEILDLVNNRHENQKTKEEINFEEEIGEDQIKSVIQTIVEKYDQEFYPFEVKYSGGGYSFLTKSTYHQVVAPVCQDKKIKKLSSAAMETLAIIAYKQPVTKAEIEYIRGVGAEYSVQKLIEKELIVIAGRKESAIGKPLLYKTTENFTDYLGIESFEDLPNLSELFDTSRVMASNVDETGQTIITKDVIEEDEKSQEEEKNTTESSESGAASTSNLAESNEMDGFENSVNLEMRKEQLGSLESEAALEHSDE